MKRFCREVENRLNGLLLFLNQLPAKLEMIADEIDNENLKNALCAAASDSTHYARELHAELNCIELVIQATDINDPGESIAGTGLFNEPMEKGKEILAICEGCEDFLAETYTTLIKDEFDDTGLKDLMHYQLSGIRSAFMRIRFLNKLRFQN